MIKLSIELTRAGPSGPVFMPQSELVETVTNKSINATRSKYEVDGWTIHSWAVAEQLAYDEGQQAATEDLDSDANPYAGHFWKHDEWFMGWRSYQESNT